MVPEMGSPRSSIGSQALGLEGRRPTYREVWGRRPRMQGGLRGRSPPGCPLIASVNSLCVAMRAMLAYGIYLHRATLELLKRVGEDAASTNSARLGCQLGSQLATK